MEIFYPNYDCWKTTVQNNSWKSYYKILGEADSNTRTIYAGHRELLLVSEIDPEYWSDYDTNFNSNPSHTSIEVNKLDDAIAHVIGMSNTVPPPLNDIDKKPVVIPYPATEGFSTFFTGAGDDLNPTPPASGRGTGTKLAWTFTGPGIETKTLDFLEIIEIHDGQLMYENGGQWDMTQDHFDVGMRMPACPLVSTPGTGNCNKYDLGGYSIIIPAAGDGQWTYDLNTAVPVPAKDKNGYFEINYKTGVVSLATPGEGNCNFFDIEIKAYSVRELPMGHPFGSFDIEAYKTESFHTTWKLDITVTKNSSGAGKAAGWLMLFRKNTT